MKTIAELHSAYANGDMSVTDAVEASLKAFEQKKELNTAITILADYARERAAQLDDMLATMRRDNAPFPILFGVPVGLKDNLQLEGHRMTAGSKILDAYESPFTATAVERLIEHGAVPVAKLNCDEFAMGSSTENSAYGPVKNPHDIERIPGGSSGGSAAAVAAEQCVVALGTDTGGSIRQPASMCGVVGMKPTYGRVSRYGAVAMASSLDQIGPLGKTVDDVARVLDAIDGGDEYDLTASSRKGGSYVSMMRDASYSLSGANIAVPKEYFTDGMDDGVKERIRSVIDWCAKQGANINEVSLPSSAYALQTYYIVQTAEVSSNLARYDGVQFGSTAEHHVSPEYTPYESYAMHVRELFGKEAKRRIMLGTYVLSAGYVDAYYRQALKVRRMIANDFKKVLSENDVILGPVSPTPAWKLGEKVDDPVTMYLSDLYTVSINLAGLPALSLPVGTVEKDGSNLPVGLHIVGDHWHELGLLKFASAVESGFGAN